MRSGWVVSTPAGTGCHVGRADRSGADPALTGREDCRGPWHRRAVAGSSGGRLGSRHDARHAAWRTRVYDAGDDPSCWNVFENVPCSCTVGKVGMGSERCRGRRGPGPWQAGTACEVCNSLCSTTECAPPTSVLNTRLLT